MVGRGDRVRIVDYEKKNAVVVPLETVQQEVGGKNFVYVHSDGAEGAYAQKVYIETGESYEGEVIISEGLKGGESLIVEGARGLSEDELIKVDNTSNITQNNG